MIRHKRPQADPETAILEQEKTAAVTPEKPVIEEPVIQGKKTVKVGGDKVVDEEVMIDYMAESFSADDAKKKTKEHVEYKSTINPDKPVGEIREEIANSEAKRSGDKFTFKDILQIATFLVNAFDGGLSILLNFIGRDNRVSVYSLPAETKRQLSEQLALILVKYQVKFKIEFLFFITLVLAYMAPVGLALKRRRAANGKADPEPQKEEKKKEPEKPVQEIVPEKNTDTIIQTPPRSRPPTGNRKGKQKKAHELLNVPAV